MLFDTIATFIDTNPNATAGDFGATIDWGDGSSDPGIVVADGHGGFDLFGAHTYDASGSYVLSIQIRDQGRPAASVASTAVIDDAAINAVGATIVATEGSAFDGVVARFDDANPGATAGDFLASIDWGDGSLGRGTIQADASGGFDVLGTHTYARRGPTRRASRSATSGGAGPMPRARQSSPTRRSRPKARRSSRPKGTRGPARSRRSPTPTRMPSRAISGPTINWGDGSVGAGTIEALGDGQFNVLALAHLRRGGELHARASDQRPGGEHRRGVEHGDDRRRGARRRRHVDRRDRGDRLPRHGRLVRRRQPRTPRRATSGPRSIGATARPAPARSRPTATAGSTSWVRTPTTRRGATPSGSRSSTSGGARVGIGGTAAVGDAALDARGTTLGATEGNEFFGVVASFNDANPGATAGDSAPASTGATASRAPGTIQADGHGGFYVLGDHTYAEEGNYALSVQVSDAGEVARASPARRSSTTPRSTASARRSRRPTGWPSSTRSWPIFTDANPSATAGDFQTTIDWGDGSSSPAPCGRTAAAASTSSARTPTPRRAATPSRCRSSTRGGRPSSSAAHAIVGTASTQLSLSGNANPAVYGTPVSFTAIVAPDVATAGTPGGTVTFLDGNDHPRVPSPSIRGSPS